MDALTKFAPAYFEYTKNAIQGQVGPLRLLLMHELTSAPHGLS